jgi:hypothetical protein
MQITLTPDQEALVRQAIIAGRFDKPEDAITEALAEASLDRGEAVVITQDAMRTLAAEVKQRGRARVAAERQQSG